MKKFIVLAGFRDSKARGWEDFRDSFQTLDEAEEFATSLVGYHWFQIVNQETLEIILEGEFSF